MFGKLKRQSRGMVRARPGERFQKRYAQRRRDRSSGLWAPLYIIVGSALFALGLTMLVAPGPGLIVLFIGAALIGQESLIVARALDRLEVQLRRVARWASRTWTRASAASKAAIAIVAACAVAGAGWTTYTLFLE